MADENNGGLTTAQQEQLASLLLTVVNQLFELDQEVVQQLNTVLLLESVQGMTTSLLAQQKALANEDSQILTERQYVNEQLGANCFADSLVGGSGNDTFYGSTTSGTWMGGGSGTNSFSDYFYNFNASDTIAGGSGKENYLMFQGDGAIGLQHVVSNGRDAVSLSTNYQTGNIQQNSSSSGGATITGLASVSQLAIGESVIGPGIPLGTTINSITLSTSSITISSNPLSATGVPLNFGGWNSDSTALITGNIGLVSGIQAIGIQTLSGNDSVTVNFGSWAGLGVYVQCGTGNDVVDASTLDGQATLLGGTGNDTIKIGTLLATGSVYSGGSGQSELDIQGSNTVSNINILNGILTVDSLPVNQRTGTTAVGSNTITGLASTALLYVGQSVTGGGLPNGATIIAIDPNTNQVTVSNAAGTGAGPNVALGFGIAFDKLVLSGGSGVNTLTSDGSLPDAALPSVVLQGGTGTNTLTATGGNCTLIGGSGPNTFVLQKPPLFTSTFFTSTGDTTANSYTVTGLSSTSGLSVGEGVTGPGIPAGTTISYFGYASGDQIVDTNTAISLSAPATATGAAVLTFIPLEYTLTGTTTYNSNVVTGSGYTYANAQVGELITGPGIPSGTTITSIYYDQITQSYSVSLSSDVTAGASNVTLTIIPVESYSVTGGSGYNTLVVKGDNQGDNISLTQYQPGTVFPWIGHPISNQNGTPLYPNPTEIWINALSSGGGFAATATNMNGESIVGGTGNDDINASGMLGGVSLKWRRRVRHVGGWPGQQHLLLWRIGHIYRRHAAECGIRRKFYRYGKHDGWQHPYHGVPRQRLLAACIR